MFLSTYSYNNNGAAFYHLTNLTILSASCENPTAINSNAYDSDYLNSRTT